MMKSIRYPMVVLVVCGLLSIVLTAGAPTGAAVAADPTPQVKPTAGTVSTVNRFNRLMKKTVEPNAPPTTDGIHDPINPGTEALQPPMEAFSPLPRGMAGNKVDWVKSLHDGAIDPRADRLDPDKKKQVMDLDIIRQVKGSMPDVVYPHKQHTEWLDCGQCHPKIFTPKKGANAISMATILAGEYCGVCHGKVAFPVSQCSKCHSKPKTEGPLTNAAAKAPPAAPPPKKAEPAAKGVLSRDDLMAKGKTVYADTCAGCHGENGEGIPGAFPALKNSDVVRGAVDGHLNVVLNGVADTAMPAWGDQLSDEDIAAVITFERNAWGNNAGDLLQPGAVKAARK